MNSIFPGWKLRIQIPQKSLYSTSHPTRRNPSLNQEDIWHFSTTTPYSQHSSHSHKAKLILKTEIPCKPTHFTFHHPLLTKPTLIIPLLPCSHFFIPPCYFNNSFLNLCLIPGCSECSISLPRAPIPGPPVPPPAPPVGLHRLPHPGERGREEGEGSPAGIQEWRHRKGKTLWPAVMEMTNRRSRDQLLQRWTRGWLMIWWW